MCKQQGETESDTNGLVKFWSNLYNKAPKLYIPFTQFDIGFTILGTCIISIIRLMSEYCYINILEFNPNTYKTVESSAAVTSITHAIILCTGLWACLTNQPYIPSAKIETSPKSYQAAVTALLQLCTGYMMYDAIFMARSNNWSFHPDDVPFLAHHVVTVLYMSQTRVLGAGHISAMGLMFTGECTNPFQNGHLITKFGIQLAQDGSLFHILHPYVELTFAVTYFFVRAFVGPIQIAHITYDLLFTESGRNNISLKVSILWVIMIWGIIIGSYPWTMECLEMAKTGLQVKYGVDFDYGPRYEL
mmetsp:Transcript_14413/g.17519  ORF Transcript_14413/g.17519 Transcript_14413/m.17519 type:complete len:303 (-) Transcript_14413:83-991(-)